VKVHVDIDLGVSLTLCRASQQLRSYSWTRNLLNHDGGCTWDRFVFGKVGIEVVLHIGELDCLGSVEDDWLRVAMVLSLIGNAVICI
jgi:hypothetical protein